MRIKNTNQQSNMKEFKMKKLLMLTAAGLIFQATPVLADHHEGGEGHKGKMFEKHDSNGDGVISESEFLEHAKKKFSEKDKNGDGVISKEEARENHESMKERWEEKKKQRMLDKRRSEIEGEEPSE